MWRLPEFVAFLFDGVAIDRDMASEILNATLADFEQRGWGIYGIECEEEPDALIGFCGLRDFEDPEDDDRVKPELLYGLRPEFWGRGFASESATEVLRMGFEEFAMPEIHAGVDRPNHRSRRVLEALGFSEWRVLQMDGLKGVQPADYAVLRPDAFRPAR